MEMFLSKHVSPLLITLLLGVCNLSARCDQVESKKSVAFVGAVLVCASAHTEDLLKTEIANWLLANGDGGFISQIIASSDYDEALFSGLEFRRLFDDNAGFDRYIAAHRDSDARHLRRTKPILRRLRIGQYVQFVFREGPEDELDSLVFRSSWTVQPGSAGGPKDQDHLNGLLWFAFQPELKLLYVFALSQGAPTCGKCKAVTNLLFRLGLPADTNVTVRTRRMAWFDDERFPRVFKFSRPSYGTTHSKASQGFLIPSIPAYYLDPEVTCETERQTGKAICALFGRWSAENACGVDN